MAAYAGGNWSRRAGYYGGPGFGGEDYFYEPEDDVAALKRRARGGQRLMPMGAMSRRIPPNMATAPGYGAALGADEPSYFDDLDMPNRMRPSTSPMTHQNNTQHEHHHHHHHYVYNCSTPSVSADSVPRQIECRGEHMSMVEHPRSGAMMRTQGPAGPGIGAGPGAVGPMAIAGAGTGPGAVRQPGLYQPAGGCGYGYDCCSAARCPASGASWGRADMAAHRGPQAALGRSRMLGP